MHFALALLVCGVAAAQSVPTGYFRIAVVDAATGRGVPLVELRTTNEISVYTDSAGVIAWNEPGLMDRDVYFSVKSHGYKFAGQGKRLRTARGGSVVLKLTRENIAERLYRITGQGIYRDSILTGALPPLREPLLNGEVMGQDTVYMTPYRGKLFWLWDDTSRAAGALGSLAGCAATSELPGNGGLDPAIGVDLRYIVDGSGFCKQITPFPVPGMKWKYWLATLKDERGRERLVTKYQSMKSLGEANEIGLAVFDDEKEVFERLTTFGKSAQSGVPAHTFDHGGFLYFPAPLPNLRVRADLKALSDESSYESFSCLLPGAKYEGEASKLDRTAAGELRYAWKRGTATLAFDQEKVLIAAGKMKAEEGAHQLRDILTGARVKPHAGSVYWNAYRARWIIIMQESRGLEDNGEIWYAEADSPVGPWVYARKIVTHDKYTFYNPTQHPSFDQDGGRLIYFEGTYSDSFSGSKVKTPRYDYNQIMYRLALDDARLFLPAPVYRLKNGQYALREQLAAKGAWSEVAEVPFYALPVDRRGEDGILVGGLFAALPPEPMPQDRGIDGRWSCREGGGFKFVLNLRRRGAVVAGAINDDSLIGPTITNGRLAFAVDIEGERYEFSMAYEGATLTGRWKKGTAGDAVTCARENIASPANSPDLVPLYSYRRGDGPAIFSTDPALKDASLKRSTTAIGRVWRNPVRSATWELPDTQSVAAKQ